MKFTAILSSCLVVMTTGGVIAQQTNKVTTNAPAAKLSTLSLSSAAGKGVPTAEEIQAFVSEYKETENSKNSLSLNVHCGVPKLSPEQKKKFERSKKVPYQLLVDLIATKEVNGKKISTRATDGKCNYAILDDTGKVIKQSSENLIKLCASWGGGGGLFGEVAKSGNYKVIVWIRKPKNVILGKVMDITLSL